ncbi:dialkylresorcinol condensing enzyme DarA [Lacinutrix sp. C3R15]|uniref:dialkylrecorsinol condensing enzyme DarA n=1 Tax=Flavobacteriaceae TaxID=49546 RepID=UPI001C08DC9D|nr:MULTISPECIES: dialkylrecorsinol condensing enzyme DarA [Flavobacteriaceae]MBU2938214.1 dialkylresorcinol condensing enzyme DarA [Lacinutrix sp. C3R15]MDO6621528.1 dialkylresorcinol condensing enzyme DarA [Oceanihabitans sp. 1_MG-2023]
MKNVLVIHYSQSGQLTEIVNNIVSPLANDSTQIDYHEIKMETPFPFPWNEKAFYGVFPDTFQQIPKKVKPVAQEILNKKYDLIILGYQIWFLTPSLPTTSFLNTADAKKLLKNTPVVTVIGCRNMWIMAQEKMKKKLIELQANLVGNIALVDRHINHISVITIEKWMMSGKKESYLGVFPKPGVSQKDIDEADKFGFVIAKYLKENNFNKLQDTLLQKGAIKIKPFLVKTDKRANVLFSKWANLIQSKNSKNSKNSTFWVKLFSYYLLFAIWILAPIVFILFLLTYVFSIHKIKKDRLYYSSVKYIE